MNEMMITNEQSVICEINYLQNGIEQKAKSCVQDAQRIGQLLKEVKNSLENSNSFKFPEWVRQNFNFTLQTAYNYMDLFQYRSKIVGSSSFTEAYKQIDEIKQIEQKTENEKARERVEVAYKTGKKPEGWRQHTDDKLLQEKKESIERQKAYEENLRRQAEEINRQEAERKQRQAEQDAVLKHTQKIISDVLEQAVKIESWKDKLHLSGNNSDIENLIISYLNGLENDTRRIECCHNIIKVCKKIVSDLTVENKDGF